MSIIPSQTKGEGTLLTLECLGIEYHTQHVFMTKPYYFENSYTVGYSIGDIYNNNRGTKQPKLSSHNIVYNSIGDHGNGLPYYNANNWEFGISEDTCYNRWMDLVDNGGSAVSAGGALTFFELSFDTTAINDIRMKLRPSGNNSTIVQVKNAVATGVKVGEQEGMLANPTGTNLLAWGSNEHGTLPIGMERYESKLLQFIFRPAWSSSVEYAVDAKVQVIDSSTKIRKHYKCTTAHTSSSTFVSDLSKWSQIDMADEFGDNIQYSPWTDDKDTLWSNSGCDPSRTTYTNGGWFDINVVVNDNEFFRTWVDGTATSDSNLDTLAGSHSYNGTRATLPRGFRVLVNGAGSGDLNNFDNMVVEYQGINSIGTKEWRELYRFDSGQTGAQVAVLGEGKVYGYTHTNSTSTKWQSIATNKYGNDCFHSYSALPDNSNGIDLVYQKSTNTWLPRSEIIDNTNRPDISKSGDSFQTNNDSAITFTSDASAISTDNDTNAPLDPWYSHAVGFNIRFPFPVNTSNSITEGVGQLYGGGATGANKAGGNVSPNWVTSTAYKEGDIAYSSNIAYICTVDHTSGTFSTDYNNKKWNPIVGEEPATLDIQNSNFTHDGQEGFNAVSNSAEDFGQINAVSFWLKFTMAGDILGGLDDERRFRAFFIDTKDNVVYQDFVIKFGGNWEEIRLPISGFSVYRGRKPLYWYEALTSNIIPPKELEVLNIFEWRNVKIFGVQENTSYDTYGRFNPTGQAISGNDLGTFISLGASQRTLEMDGFRFIKPLLATSDNNTSRNLQPTFQQFPNITVYDQLLNVAKSHLEIEKFKHKEFNVESTGDEIFDVNFGESFYLNNDDIISESDGSVTGQIKLVAKRIEYSVTKPSTGKGGLRRKMKGVKVFT